ncbi:GILT-like protein 3 isoform X2 [Condylostylus longicornis]|uniref:GILT-like protein 3 isoform X2 n=1 Tax=Condylostylus longicornis TaxID=2530218 RepID=UPI00244DC11A|nr:GILT-like protein 3 isoform X2 [Condylostylus longicornis]
MKLRLNNNIIGSKNFKIEFYLITKNDRIKLNVYYETLCGDSIIFFRRHLTRSLVSKNLLEYVDLKLIPYGKAEIYVNPHTNNTEIICQHGPKECEQNALHACVVENNGNTKDTILLLNCMMNGYNNDIEFCSNYYSINVDDAKECAKNRTIIDILRPFEIETNKISLTFVPSISFDDNFEAQGQYNLRNKFESELCKRYINKFGSPIEGCP